MPTPLGAAVPRAAWRSAFGRLLAECSRELGLKPTVAQMTQASRHDARPVFGPHHAPPCAPTVQTKSHNYAPSAGFTSASSPSRLSIVVHGLKWHDTWPSGPNHTIGGAWAQTHATAALWRLRGDADAGFPPLLWEFDPTPLANGGWPPNGTGLQPVDGARQAWYAAACPPRRSVLRRRAEALVASVKGPRPSGSKEDDYLGGSVAHWTGHGCHPSRGYAYPRFPQLAERNRALEITPRAEYRVMSYVEQCTRCPPPGTSLAFDWELPGTA